MFNVYSTIIIFLIYIRLVKAYSPGARSFHASIRNDTKLYFFGGYIDDYSVGGDVFYLDLEESFSRTLPKWIEKSKANIEIMHSSVCKSARDSFIFIGGTYRKSDHMPDKETPFIEYHHKYDIWSLPYNAEPFDWRINVQCVSDNEGSVYIFSEYNQHNNIMYILNTINMTWSTGPIENGPSYRHGYTSTMLSDGVIVYIGGCNESGCMPMSLINVYDTKINKWSLISARGQDIGFREYHSAVLGPDHSIIVFGGYDYHGKQYPYPHLAILNITRISCEWSIPKVSNNADTPPLLYAHSATSIDKYMIVAFGYEGSISGHEKYNEELYIFDMESHCWVNKFAVPEPPPPPPPSPTPTSTPTSLPPPPPPPEHPPYFSVDPYYRGFVNLFIIRIVAISTLVIGHLYKTYK